MQILMTTRGEIVEKVPAVASRAGSGARVWVRRLWTAEPLLTGTAIGVLALLIPAGLGLWLDPRVITGAPAWLKPAKFALSIGVYALTLSWVLLYLPDWPRTRRIAGRLTASMLILEMALIVIQAARGTTSHFNVATPLDTAIFAAMGIGILVQTLASVAVAVALFRQTFTDRALGWALRLGVTITIIGASTGGLMTTPTAAQLAAAHQAERMVVSGAHTVGGPDGGPGLPVTGWSTSHGDVRVAHFVGLHAMQALPLIALLFRRRSEKSRVRFTLVAGAAYALLFAGLLLQALRGLPLVAIS